MSRLIVLLNLNDDLSFVSLIDDDIGKEVAGGLTRMVATYSGLTRNCWNSAGAIF